jgi:CTP:molybdopterin cytidylyltransferase MocA
LKNKLLTNTEDSFSAVILSSGLSERMGQPKALLKWDVTTTFIEKIINEFIKAGCTRIICMINGRTEPFCCNLNVSQNVRFVVNQHPDWGRFYSVRTGLREIKESKFCFVHNVDNPFIDSDTLEKLIIKRNPEAWCSPVVMNKGGHPVLLPNTIIRKINETDDLNTVLSDVLSLYPKITVEVNNNTILRNINTPEDYDIYFKFNIL